MKNCHDKESHKQHICVLAGDKKFDKIRRLVAHPRFICHQCGRVSDHKENLCDPELLESPGSFFPE